MPRTVGRHWREPHSAAVVICAMILHASLGKAEQTPPAPIIVRLAPSTTMGLPASFVRDLIRQGCTIPQPLSDVREGKRANFISGSFAKRGQKDHAVLCSRDGVSHIRVYWGGRTRCPSRIEYGKDLDRLEDAEPGVLGYARAIDPAPQETIAYFRDAFDGPKPPDTSHAGIDDSYMGKASAIWYCAHGAWTRLQGMD